MNIILSENDIVDMVLESIQDILASKKKLKEYSIDGMDITDFVESIPELSSILYANECNGRRILLSGRAFITGVEPYDIELLDYFLHVDWPETRNRQYVDDELTNEFIDYIENGDLIETMDIKSKIREYIKRR